MLSLTISLPVFTLGSPGQRHGQAYPFQPKIAFRFCAMSHKSRPPKCGGMVACYGTIHDRGTAGGLGFRVVEGVKPPEWQ